jgi:hypothetical protein
MFTDKALKVMKGLRKLTYVFAVQKLEPWNHSFHSDVHGFTMFHWSSGLQSFGSGSLMQLICFIHSRLSMRSNLIDKIRLGLLQTWTGQIDSKIRCHRRESGSAPGTEPERNNFSSNLWSLKQALTLICTTVFWTVFLPSLKPAFPAFKNQTAWPGTASGPEKAQRNGELWRMAYSITGPLQVASRKHPKTMLFCRNMKHMKLMSCVLHCITLFI